MTDRTKLDLVAIALREYYKAPHTISATTVLKDVKKIVNGRNKNDMIEKYVTESQNARN